MAIYFKLFILLVLICFSNWGYTQVLTREDSLQAGLVTTNKTTVISGYGEAKYSFDAIYHTYTANLTRVVLFVGHKFNDKIYFFSELEIADAKVESGQPGGEVGMEQAFLKFQINRNMYITAGLFIPRIGITNENHLPTTFNGTDRPFVETFLIPATWRELGVSLYGSFNRVPGLNYSIGVLNGLNSAGFTSGTGIKNGRFDGQMADAGGVAITGSLLYYINNFRVQVSSYYGGSAGLSKFQADSLSLNYGAFGTPVLVNEANIQYNKNGFSVKALASVISIPEADKINSAYASNTPSLLTGGYVEVAYNILRLFDSKTIQNATVFARYEQMDLNKKIPANGIENDVLKKKYFVTGITYQPIKGVAIKVDYVSRSTGDINPALIINPYPQAQPYYTTNGFLNVGIAYSF